MLGDGRVSFKLTGNLRVRMVDFWVLILVFWRMYSIASEHIAWHE
jgi:hypothetical protein